MLLRAPHLALLVGLCGCARKPMLLPSAREEVGHEVFYRGGQLFVVSRAPRSIVVLAGCGKSQFRIDSEAEF